MDLYSLFQDETTKLELLKLSSYYKIKKSNKHLLSMINDNIEDNYFNNKICSKSQDFYDNIFLNVNNTIKSIKKLSNDIDINPIIYNWYHNIKLKKTCNNINYKRLLNKIYKKYKISSLKFNKSYIKLNQNKIKKIINKNVPKYIDIVYDINNISNTNNNSYFNNDNNIIYFILEELQKNYDVLLTIKIFTGLNKNNIFISQLFDLISNYTNNLNYYNELFNNNILDNLSIFNILNYVSSILNNNYIVDMIINYYDYNNIINPFLFNNDNNTYITKQINPNIISCVCYDNINNKKLMMIGEIHYGYDEQECDDKFFPFLNELYFTKRKCIDVFIEEEHMKTTEIISFNNTPLYHISKFFNNKIYKGEYKEYKDVKFRLHNSDPRNKILNSQTFLGIALSSNDLFDNTLLNFKDFDKDSLKNIIIMLITCDKTIGMKDLLKLNNDIFMNPKLNKLIIDHINYLFEKYLENNPKGLIDFNDDKDNIKNLSLKLINECLNEKTLEYNLDKYFKLIEKRYRKLSIDKDVFINTLKLVYCCFVNFDFYIIITVMMDVYLLSRIFSKYDSDINVNQYSKFCSTDTNDILICAGNTHIEFYTLFFTILYNQLPDFHTNKRIDDTSCLYIPQKFFKNDK